MTDEEPTTESEPDIEIDLAAPDAVAYDELTEKFGDELIEGDIQEAVKQRVRSLYDNQSQIEQRLAQAQQQAARQQ